MDTNFIGIQEGGNIVSKGKSQWQLDFEAKQNETLGEMTREQVTEIFTKTVKHDEATTQVLFYGVVLNYTESEQMNFSVTGPSSTGKTYLPGEILRVFPPEDIHWKGYTSPKAFYHERGKLRFTATGEELPSRYDYVDEKMRPWLLANPKPAQNSGIVGEWRELHKAAKAALKQEWEDLDKQIVVNLHQKIEVFIDQPSDALQRELRPILSHDRKELEASITDRTAKGSNRTKKVIIVGYPTTISSSVSHLLDEQEQTRHIQISPEVSQDKFLATIKQQSVALSDKDKYKLELEQHRGFEILTERVLMIKKGMVRDVIIREELRENIYTRFIENNPILRPRHQRDFPRLISFIKAHALFNQWTREHIPDGTKIYANDTDIDEAFAILEPLLESNELGIPPHEYKFFIGALEPALTESENGLHRNDVSALYFEHYKTRIGQKRRDNMIKLFLETGLVEEATDPDDKRSKRIYSPGGVSQKNEDVEESEKALGLREKMQVLLELMQELDYPAAIPEMFEAWKDEVGFEVVDELKKILLVMVRDGAIYQPTPGFWEVA